MPIRKKKISDLTLADSLKGLYTIGYKVVGGVKTSVKVGLEYIQVAYEDVVKATQDAISAAKTALTAASTADTSREAIEDNELERESNESARKTSEQERAAAENQRATAETGRDNAEKARVTEFSKIKTDAEKATGDAISATGKTNEATQNANAATAAANQAAIEANKSAENAEGKAQAAQVAANNANDTAEHPTYIGQDHYVYKWDKTTSSYDKTDIYTKGDAFSIKKVYASVAELEADTNNTGIAEGDFVLVNTGDVENPDNAKLYVKAKSDAGVYSYEFLVDMSGAIGFTGKTPQFSMGTISTLEAGSSATATVSEDGVDSDGNPKYKINFAIPRGNPGAPFNPVGQYDTLELLQAAIPDGSGVNGMIAVGTEAPYEYYAWLNGGWVNQGKVAGGGSGNIVVIPSAVMGLTEQSSSAEILNAFGSKDDFIDICKKLYNNDDAVCVLSYTEVSTKYTYTIPYYSSYYENDEIAQIQLNIEDVANLRIILVAVANGVAVCMSQSDDLLIEAPSDGNTYGRKNQDWVEVPGKSDVLTKTNSTEYTPTGDYQPATKKYVDTSLSDNRGIGYMMTKTVIDATGLDENTWYPVTISLYNEFTVRIEVIVGLNSDSNPQWATHTGGGGFSVRKIWEVNGLNWGRQSLNREIFISDYTWAISDPVRGIGQLTNSSNEYVFVRGGGRYFFFTSHNTIPILRTETYEEEGQSVSPTTEEPALIVANISTDDKLKTMFADITADMYQNINNISGYGIASIQNDADATTERNYPINESGTLFYGKGPYGSVNGIFGSYLSNRWFARGGGRGSSQMTSWREFAFKDDIDKGIISSGSIDGITVPGEYIITGDVTNDPFTGWCFLKVMGSTSHLQVLVEMNTLRIAIRQYVNGVWSSWKFVATSDNLSTITKMTTSEYNASSKDSQTAYFVTD